VASPAALVYLGYRALVAHPLRKVFRRRGTGLERFRSSYVAEGLTPTTPEDRALGLAAQGCIACGLCETGCALVGATPEVRALGVHAAFRLYSRHPVELPLAAAAFAALAACGDCAGCAALCPTGVPIDRLVSAFAARAGSRGPARLAILPPR
jgi:succinate dehydrogenase/fumarate reductase-like Fe-S protein